MKLIYSFWHYLKHRIYLALSHKKEIFFKNDISVFGYSFLIFSIGIGLYFLLPWLGKICPSIAFLPPPWDFSIFFPFWVSAEGLLITFMVSLNLSLKNAEDEIQFIDFLSSALARVLPETTFIVIIPNINLAQYNHHEEFEKIKSILLAAIKKKVILEFITPNIDIEYLASYDSTKDIEERLKFFKEGYLNNSLGLSYLYKRYGEKLASNNICDETISFLKEILKDVKIYPCNQSFIDSKIIGYSSEVTFFIGRYIDRIAENGNVTVAGQNISNITTIEILNSCLIPEIIERYKA